MRSNHRAVGHSERGFGAPRGMVLGTGRMLFRSPERLGGGAEIWSGRDGFRLERLPGGTFIFEATRTDEISYTVFEAMPLLFGSLRSADYARPPMAATRPGRLEPIVGLSGSRDCFRPQRLHHATGE